MGRTMKRALVYTINAILILVIAGIITATWLPAIYTSQWFQSNAWIRAHVLQNDSDHARR